LGITPESVGLPNQSGGDGGGEPRHAGAGPVSAGSRTSVGTASDYFRKKDPQGLIEALAVAVRYRELTEGADVHTKEQLDAVFKSARRDTPANFSRDVRNGKKQQYFNRGRDLVLSHFGQSYIDALPDREAAKAIARPKKAGGKRKRKTAAR